MEEVKKNGQTQIKNIYDQVGNILKVIDFAGNLTAYTYDKAGIILKVDGQGKIAIYAYGAGNRIAVNETYKSLQPSGFIDDATGNDVQYILKKTDYTYSNAGKLIKLVERMYDDSNKEVLRKTVNYYYDGNGNELSNTANWTHPHDIKLRQSTKGSVYADNMENSTDSLIDRENNTYDGFGRLVKVERITEGVRSTSEYLYNGDNLRVRKTVKKSTNGYKEEVTNYLYDRQYVILETDENNKVSTRYVKGINYIASISADNTSYFLFNGHGDVVQTVDKTGEVQNNYDYDIWGNPTLTVETTECAIRYAGEFYDSETGLYYLRARYYDPYIGRFISEDSYWGEDDNPLSLNRYTYAHNDPIQFLDPSGYAVIKKGAEGDGVVAIQEMLQDLGYNTGKADGIFGSKTEAAIKQFQKDNGLKVDGIVGNQSITALKTLSGVIGAPDYAKASAKKSLSNVKTGDIKDDVTLMSTKTFDKALNNITTVQKATGGGSVKYEVKNNTVVITGATVKGQNSKNSEVKVTPGNEIKADSDKDMAEFTSTVSNVTKSQNKQSSSSSAGTKPSLKTSSNSNKKNQENIGTGTNTAKPNQSTKVAETSIDELTLSQVIENNPDSYPYDLDSEGFYESQQYYLAWYYGTEAYDRLDPASLGHNSYLVYELDGMRKDGIDLSSLTVAEMDQLSFDIASFWNKADQVALGAYAAYSMYSYSKSVKGNTSTTPQGTSETVAGGAKRAAQYADEWGNASLDDAIKKFAPNSTAVETSTGKLVYGNSDTGINVVYDKAGDYFRIENTNISGSRRYLDLNGNTLYNKIVDGKTMGIPKSEYQQLTHFNNVK